MSTTKKDKFGPMTIKCNLTREDLPYNGEGVTLVCLQKRALKKLQDKHPGAVLKPETLRFGHTDGYNRETFVSVERERSAEEMELLKIEAIELIQRTAAAVGIDVSTVIRSKK